MTYRNQAELDEMRKMFFDEAAENLTNLEQQIHSLENDVNDQIALTEIYRILHTFKGTSGTMGIIEMERFFHEIESLVSLAQEKKVEITPEFISLLYEITDLIEQALDKVRNGNTLTNFFDPILKKVSKFKPSNQSGEESEKKGRMKELFNQSGLEEFKPEALVFDDPNRFFYSITVTLEKNIRLKTARVFVVIKNLRDAGVIAKTEPPLTELLEGKLEDTFTVLFQSDQSKKNIEDRIFASGEIESSKVELITADQAKNMLEVGEREKEAIKESVMMENVAQSSGVKVDLPVLDQLLELFGELLIRSKQLERKIGEFDRQDIKEVLFQMQTYMFTLQDVVLKMQLVPLETIFRVFPRLIRTLADKENKKVKLVVNHHDIKVDRKMLNGIGDILTHILRNAVYHGIETPEERSNLGKSEEGRVQLDATMSNNVLNIKIKDDGQGVNLERVRKVALEKHIHTNEELNKMTTPELINIIFEENFSSVSSVNLTSGRGLGLKIVKEKVAMLGGSLSLETHPNEGTTFIIQLPISRSLFRALLVRCCNQTYSIPLDDIQKLFSAEKSDFKVVDNQEYVVSNDTNELLPVYYLAKLFKLEDGSEKEQTQLNIVHIKKGDKNYALVVDDFIQESEIVIKKIDDLPREVKGLSGAAILDDGSVSFIIDPFSVVS